MPKLPSLTSKDVVRILKKLGFQEVRQKGSHKFFLHPVSRRTTVVPMHSKDLGKGLIRKIISDTDVNIREFTLGKK